MKKNHARLRHAPGGNQDVPARQRAEARKEEFETVVTVTGQHREMLDQVLRVFGVAPDHDWRS